jgi:aminotransferase
MLSDKSNQVVKGAAPFLSAFTNMSPIEQAQAVALAEPGVISLVPGIPSFPTARHIRRGVHDAIDKGLTDRYTAGHGIIQLREAIVEKLRRKNNVSVTTDCVMVTHGAIQALMAILTAVTGAADEIILLSPCFADHITQIRIAGRGRMPTFVPLFEVRNEWFLDPSRLEASINKNTKAILFSNPCNPTGKAYSLKELSEIAEIAQRHNLLVIVDEMYEYFVYEAKPHISITSLPDIGDRAISIYGTSKTYAMSGWRIGYIVASRELIASIFKVHDAFITCPTAASQFAALAALKGDQGIVNTYREAYEHRRRMVIEELDKIEVMEVATPNGAYYTFPKFVNIEMSDDELSSRLIQEAKVAVVPGSVFGPGGEGHVRISFAGDDADLREGLRRLVEFFRANKNIRFDKSS